MKAKTLEILIVIAILFVVGLVVGCKDKAEANEPSQFEERIHWDEDAEGITIIDCTFANEPEIGESTQSCKSEHIHLGNPCEWNIRK